MDWVWAAWTSIRWIWSWIERNHNPLTVLLTLVGVLVAWRYVVLTSRLAEAARDQAGAAREQAAASRMAAQAAADQARVTRLMFEANRPVLRIRSEHSFVQGATPKAYDHYLTFALENHGTAPATVVSWDLTVKRGDQIIRETHEHGPRVSISVPPEAVGETSPAFTEQIPHLFRGGGAPVEVEAKVTYRGVGEKIYTTQIHAVLSVTAVGANPSYLVVDTVMGEG
jgi:hypothetical protein